MLSGLNVFSPGHVLITGKSYGAEIGYNLSMADKNADWVKRLRVDAIGITAGYRNMGGVLIRDSVESKGFLGDVYTLSARMNISLLRSEQTKLLLTSDAGFTYSSSSYFIDGNPIVSSRINFSPKLGLKFQTKLSGHTSIVASSNIFHYSNIAIRVPNNGVNSFEVSLGVIKDLKERSVKASGAKAVGDNLKSFFEAGVDVGRRGTYKTHSGNWKSGFYLGYNRKINPTISMKVGADAVYYYTTFDGSAETDQYFATSFDPWRYGLSAGSDIWFGKVALMTNYGYYLKFNGKYDVKTYWNAGFKYYLSSSVAVQGKGYVHKSQADYLGFGVMYRFGKTTFKPAE
ncbi:MAG: acyloxyacyl hydrolase [Daejeonella sp.]